ncbi:hypothetical protein GCM10027447_21070 [Glycomyces halotolerans]
MERHAPDPARAALPSGVEAVAGDHSQPVTVATHMEGARRFPQFQGHRPRLWALLGFYGSAVPPAAPPGSSSAV